MRFFRFLLWPAVLAAAFSGCDELPITPPAGTLIPTSTFKLNLPVGRSWVYVDSVRTIGPQISLVVRNVVVTVIGKDSLSAELRDLLRLQIVTRDGDSLCHSAVWYRHNDDGLWEVAYENGENVFAFPRVNDGGGPLPMRYSSASSNSCASGAQGGNMMQSIMIRAEPRLVVKYPLHTGEEWVAFAQPFRRTMKCVGEMQVIVPKGQYSAYHLQGHGDADPAADFTINDFFGAEGLLQREMFWRNLNAYSPSGQLLPYPIDIEERMVLIDMVG